MKLSFLKSISPLLILSIAMLSCTGKETESAAEPPTKPAAEETVDKAPDFEVTTIDGKVISLQSSLENDKPVVVYFTASWCPICARNWPVLSEVYPEFEDRLTLVAISIDPTDTEEVMQNLADDKDFKFPSTEGHPDIMVDFGVSSQATTVGVDRNGNIAFRKNKQALTADEYRELFTSLVN